MPKLNPTSKKIGDEISDLARAATGAAYRRAVRAGSVVIFKDGEIRRIDADGESKVMKKLPPRVQIPKGSKFELNG